MGKVRGRKKKSRAGRGYFILMMLFLIVVMSVQITMLHNKSAAYAAKEAQLLRELSHQEDEKAELSDYEQYTQSEEYTRNTAKSKLGLVFPNEIIFRESKN